MDGYEMTQTLRKSGKYQDLPIVAVTSVSGEKAKAKGLKAGMDAYLIKLDREEILHHINGYLNQGRTWKK
jgi:two-component system chemotaxis sensor kinase CheA